MGEQPIDNDVWYEDGQLDAADDIGKVQGIPDWVTDWVTVAVISAGVGAFVNSLFSKAGEDTYAGVRLLLKRLFDKGHAVQLSEERPKNPLLIVEDPDPSIGIAIILGVDTPDEQLRALRDFDVDAALEEAQRRASKESASRIRIRWDETSKSWRVFWE